MNQARKMNVCTYITRKWQKIHELSQNSGAGNFVSPLLNITVTTERVYFSRNIVLDSHNCRINIPVLWYLCLHKIVSFT